MNPLTAEETRAFRRAASEFLAAQERLELLATEPGVSNERHVAQVMDALARVKERVLEISRNHPELSGLRFRGHIFAAVRANEPEAIHVMRESDIVTVDE